MIDLRHGDMRDVLPTIEAESVHSCVTDPPYELAFMGRHWDQTGVAFQPDTWRAVHRVLKPGGYLLAFASTRGYHRMVCAIEDAGFEVRDTIAWVYGSGFPKSLDIGKAIDRAAGAERAVIGPHPFPGRTNPRTAMGDGWQEAPMLTAPATDAARQWNGWGTALKPGIELVCVARKPLSERTVAANVLRHGTGGINVAATRIGTTKDVPASVSRARGNSLSGSVDGTLRNQTGDESGFDPNIGRWPANLCHDSSPEVEAAFAAFGESAPSRAAERGLQHSGRHGGLADLGGNLRDGTNTVRGHDDAGGSPSRFFYSSKAGAGDRADSRHPTIKPIALMQWLVRLVTPPGGTVLDPFAGSGTTGEAAMLEGFNALLIEREVEHHADIQHRQRRWHGGDLPLFAEAAD